MSVDGGRGWMLDHEKGDHDADLVRLLGGFDLFLQGEDRQLLVPDKSRHKRLWPVLGRPGAVLFGVEIVGTWRPKAAGRTFTLRLTCGTRSPRWRARGSRTRRSGWRRIGDSFLPVSRSPSGQLRVARAERYDEQLPLDISG